MTYVLVTTYIVSKEMSKYEGIKLVHSDPHKKFKVWIWREAKNEHVAEVQNASHVLASTCIQV